MGGGVRAEVGGVQSGPLAAGTQHVEDGVGTPAIGGARLAPAKPMGIPVLGEQTLQQGPQGLRHAKSCCYFVHGRPRAAFSGLCHTLTLSNSGYPDRHLANLPGGRHRLPQRQSHAGSSPCPLSLSSAAGLREDGRQFLL